MWPMNRVARFSPGFRGKPIRTGRGCPGGATGHDLPAGSSVQGVLPTVRHEKPGFPRFRPLARMETDLVDPRATMVKKRKRGYALRPKGFPTIRLLLPALAGRLSVELCEWSASPTGTWIWSMKSRRNLPRCEVGWGSTGVRKRRLVHRRTAENAAVLGRQASGEEWRCIRGSNRSKERPLQLARLRYREKVRNRNTCHRARLDRDGLIAVEAELHFRTKSGGGRIGRSSLRETSTQCNSSQSGPGFSSKWTRGRTHSSRHDRRSQVPQLRTPDQGFAAFLPPVLYRPSMSPSNCRRGSGTLFIIP